MILNRRLQDFEFRKEEAVKIKINDAVVEITDGLTIAGLLAHQKVKMPDMVSVQLNGTIVERDQYPGTPVSENDAVEFLYFMGGGCIR